MIELSPKLQWQKLRKEDSERFANLIVDPVIRTAITYTLAELTTGPITTDELNGAKKFIMAFTALSDEIKQSERHPAKELSQ